MKTILTNIKRASVEMILLSLLEKEDRYGYQMTQEIKERSNGQFTLLEGSMYPILSRLSKNGDVELREERAAARMIRVYYHLTDSGHKRLEEMRKTFREQLALIDLLTDYTEKNKNG